MKTATVPRGTTSAPQVVPLREIRVKIETSEDSEITTLRAQIEDLETKLALYRRREQLDIDYARCCDVDQQRASFTPIFQAVCTEYGIPMDLLWSRDRTVTVSEARHIAVTLIRERTDMSLHAIGRIFYRDHGTILHSLRAFKDLGVAPGFTVRVARIRSLLSTSTPYE